MREATWPYPTSDEVSHLAITEVEVLRARIDQLLEERRDLKKTSEVQGDMRHIPYGLKLTPQEERLLLCLIKTPKDTYATKERLHVALSTEAEPTTDLKMVDVLICKIRKKLRTRNMEIMTHWGKGYGLAPATHDYFWKSPT